MTDKELFKVCKGFRKGLLGKNGNPDSMCFAASTALQGYLSFCGLSTKLCKGVVEFQPENILCEHYWLQLSDNRIIDITGSQFNEYGVNMPDVYIGDKPHFYDETKSLSNY